MRIIDFLVDGAAFEQLRMCAASGDSAVVEDDDLVRMRNRGRALRHDENGVFPLHCPDSGAQARVRGIIERGGAVVKDDNIGIADKGACDAEPLTLSAGEIFAALLDYVVEAALLALDDVARLGGIECAPDFLVGGIRLAPSDIFPNGAVKEHRLLHDNADFFL